jgi:hypothetical protein
MNTPKFMIDDTVIILPGRTVGTVARILYASTEIGWQYELRIPISSASDNPKYNVVMIAEYGLRAA